MVSELARGDFEDMVSDGLRPTLDDFDRLNQLALRLTDGAETTAANAPRIGWAGDVPFHQPTCAAMSWYLSFVERTDFDGATKDACWFFALAHARERGAFSRLVGRDEISEAVNAWLSGVTATRGEIVRACRFAARGFEDAEAGRTDAARETDERMTDDERRERTLANIEERVTVASALCGVAPSALEHETPSRLERMIEAAQMNAPIGGCCAAKDKGRLTAEYQLAYREIRKRLSAERDERTKNGENAEGS